MHYVRHAPRAPVYFVPRVLRVLVPYVSRSLRVVVPQVPRALRTLVPTVLSWPTCLTSHVTRALRAPGFHVSRASCAWCSIWPRALYFISPFFLRTLLFRTLCTLCPNITFFALEFPCTTLLFFYSFATCDFFWEIC